MHSSRRHIAKAAACVAAAFLIAGLAEAQEIACGSLENGYGPYDYTNPVHVREHLPIVDSIHFTREVEALVEGSGTGNVPLDLDYVLRAFPNHHRALYAMARLQLEKGRPSRSTYRTADCYFFRAMQFKPDDGMVYLVFGTYLQRKGEVEQALENYQKALALAPESAEAHYNIGLLHFKNKNYDAAVESARRAYEFGYPLPGLRNQLIRVGRWKDDP